MSGETKVADMANSLRQRIPVNRGMIHKALEWYHLKYFKTGSFTPVVHVMLAAGIFGYAMEYEHIKHELEHAKQEAKKV